jgi:YVTN family beta-propeller protein
MRKNGDLQLSYGNSTEKGYSVNRLHEHKRLVLMTVVALPAALALGTLLGGCGGGDAQAQAAVPATTIAPVVDIASTQGTGPEGQILFSGGGPATRIWLIDSKYERIVAAIDADGTDGRHIPTLKTAHQYVYPELHDNHSAVTNLAMDRIYGTVWGSYDEPSYAVEYDPKTLLETRRAPAGKGAHHSAMSPDDKYLYVANQYEKFLSVIDVATFTKVKDIDLGAMVVYPSKTSYFWKTDANGVSRRIPIPTKYIFVTVTGEPPLSNFAAAPANVTPTNAVAVIDIATNTLVKKIPIGQSVHSVNLTTDGKEAWVSGKTVTVIDTETLAIKGTIPYASTHQNFSPDGKYGYLTSGGSLIKIDRSTWAAVWKASDGGSAHVQVSNDGSRVYTQGTNTTRYPYLLGGRPVAGIQVFSAVDGRLITEIPFNNGTHEMEIIPKSSLGLAPVPVAPTPAASGPAPTNDGAALYASSCAACHGALASSTKTNKTAASIQSAIDAKVGGMGSLSSLTPAQVSAIAAALAPVMR